MLLPLLAACSGPPAPPPTPPLPAWESVARDAFNAGAADLALGLYWRRSDDARIDPDELVSLWGLGEPLDHWVRDGAFTDAFATAYGSIVDHVGATGPDARGRAVLAELHRTRPSLLAHSLSPADQRIVGHIAAAAREIEALFALQRGADRYAGEVRTPYDRALFHRNQGPWCEQAGTRDDPDCRAVPGPAPHVWGLYPPAWSAGGSCDALAAHPDAEALLAPFTVIREREGALVALPYTEVWAGPMRNVADHLDRAAAALPPDEDAFRAYLVAAAGAFRDNDWFAADAAWAAMNATNSRWYLRIGPDETYFEPCDRKAGFHVSFARINPGSVTWRQKLEPVKAELEQALAARAGPPYVAREVAFELPDFIDIVLNAGDSRSASGATIGQSLPNWGPVAAAGGRTVAMTNLDSDPDTVAGQRARAASVFCEDAMVHYTDDPEPLVMSTVLHEAAHNLGPSHDYRVQGRNADEAFGGTLASTLEELKAQTAALYLTDWLSDRGIVSSEMALQAHVRDLAWSFGHVANGMYDADGDAQSYSHLSAIQLGLLLDDGALSWKADTTAANGTDRGCLTLDAARLTPSIAAMAVRVLGIKARNDVAAANALVAAHVDGDAHGAQAMHATIAERWRRVPMVTFVYALPP